MWSVFASIHTVQIKCQDPSKQYRIGGLSNDNDDGTENGKKQQNLCTHTLFFVHFFAATVRLQRESAYNFTFCGGRERKTTTFVFSFPKF